MNLAQDNEDALLCLHADDDTRYPLNSHEIPIWGKPIVYDSRQQALDSLKPTEDSTDLQFVRLVLVCEYDLLKRLLCGEKEVVRSREAGLYLQVAQTCPAYYATWDDSPTGHVAHEVSSYLKRSDTRETLLRSFIDKEGGAPAPAKLNVFRVIDAATPGAIVKVIPGVSVVRLGWYHDASAGGSEAGSQASSNAAKSATTIAWRKKTTTNISEEELSVLLFFWWVGVIRLLVFVQDTDDVARG